MYVVTYKAKPWIARDGVGEGWCSGEILTSINSLTYEDQVIEVVDMNYTMDDND